MMWDESTIAAIEMAAERPTLAATGLVTQNASSATSTGPVIFAATAGRSVRDELPARGSHSTLGSNRLNTRYLA